MGWLRLKRMLVSLLAVGAGLLASCGGSGGGSGSVVQPARALSLVAGSLKRPSADDGAGEAAGFNSPEGVAIDAAGNVYVADTGNHIIRKVSVGGVVTTIAGAAGEVGNADGTGAAARFSSPRGIAVDASGNVYVADTDNYTIRRITPAGVVTTVAGAVKTPGAADGSGASLRSPTDIAVGPAGELFVAADSAVRRIGPDGAITTFAGLPGHPGVVAGDGVQARFTDISGIAVDGSGNVYVSESSGGEFGTVQGRLRKFSPSGQAIALGASTDGILTISFAAGIAVDTAGNVYIASGGVLGFSNQVFSSIHRVSASGQDVLLAGGDSGLRIIGDVDGLGAQARVNEPRGIAVGAAGRVVFADTGNHAIRQIDAQGVVSTLAGGAGGGLIDGNGAQARFFGLTGLSAAGDGSLYVADSGNLVVRKISPQGLVSTLQFIDASGPAISFRNVLDVAPNPQGGLYVLLAGSNDLLLWSCNAAGRCQDGGRSNGIWAFDVDSAGNLYISEQSSVSVIAADGSKRVLRSDFNFAAAVVVGGGKVYVADSNDHTVRILDASSGNVLQTVGMSGASGLRDGSAVQALFATPGALTLDAAGNLYISDAGAIRRLSADGATVSTIAGVAGGQTGVLSASAVTLPGGAAGLAWAAGSLYATIGNAVMKIAPVN